MAKAESASQSLQRGKACLRCRKRKMRCDGTKPSCQQCIKAGKEDCCEYDDGKTKTRTQIMRETIMKLEQRVKELEDPDHVPTSTSSLPNIKFERHQRSHSSSSSSASFPGSPNSFTHSPSNSDTTNSPEEPWSHLPTTSPSPSLSSGDFFFEAPIELNQMLLDIFAPHRHQCALDLHMGRLRDSLSLPGAEPRHSSLMNAIYLWACFVSRPEALSQHEPHYLALALEGINEGLKSSSIIVSFSIAPERILDVIQASCMLAMYFIANGRFMEGSYHAGAATSMAVQYGLHRPDGIPVAVDISPSSVKPASAFVLPPPRDAIERAERMLLFWQCFNLDRCYSVVLGKPVVIPDVPCTNDSIDIPWPKTMSEYELMDNVPCPPEFQTVGCFLAGAISNTFSASALRAKASALFHHAHQLSFSMDMQLTPNPLPHETIHTTDLLINQYITTLPPLQTLMHTPSFAAAPEDRYLYLTSHILSRCALIYVHRPYARENPGCYDKCLDAARDVLDVLRCLGDCDWRFVEVIFGTCLLLAAETLIRELDSIDASWPLLSNTDVRNEIGMLLYAMNCLEARFVRCTGTAIPRIQKRLADV